MLFDSTLQNIKNGFISIAALIYDTLRLVKSLFSATSE